MNTFSVDVGFSGSRSGEAPVTWGQGGILEAMSHSPASFNLRSRIRLSDLSVDLPSTCAALSRLLSRHESLRTLITGDGNEARQVVQESGSLRITALDCEPANCETAAAHLTEEQSRESFGRTELPIRVSLVVSAGIVQFVLLTFSHVAVDGTSMRLIEFDLRELLRTSEVPTETLLQPLDIARFETGKGMAINAAAMRYWAQNLRRIPPRMLTQVGHPHEPRGQQVTLSSTVLQPAAQRVAARYGTPPSAVVLAATAWLLARRVGKDLAAMNLIFANRFRTEYQRVVANLAQVGLFAVDVPHDSTFEETIRPTAIAAFQAHRYSYYDQTALRELRARIGVERRTVPPNPFCCFNNMAVNTFDDRSPHELSPEAVMAGLLRTTTSWSQNPPQFRCHFCLLLGGTLDGAHKLILSADTAYFPPDDMEEFLHALEATVVLAAFPQAAPTGHQFQADGDDERCAAGEGDGDAGRA